MPSSFHSPRADFPGLSENGEGGRERDSEL